MQPDIRPVKDRIADAIAYPSWFVEREAGERADKYAARAVLAVLEAIAPHHVIDLTDHGWTLSHSMGCRLNGDLFTCPVTAAAGEFVPATPPGRYVCDMDDDGVLVIGEEVPHA
jgi:hypothetical protein